MAHPLDRVGQVLAGKYKLLRLVGQGGMGVVYEAVRVDLGQRVALKLLLRAPHDHELRGRFAREAHIMAGLSNVHVVRLLDFVDDPTGTMPFIVMEYLEGSSLAAVVERTGPMNPGRAAKLGVQLLDGVAALHRAGIVHRDLKPQNVMLVGTGTLGELAKILDFGVAKLERPDLVPPTRDGKLLGSLAYMAPEQARGERVDHRADIFGAGTCLYFALTGLGPYGAKSGMEAWSAAMAGERVPLSGVAPQVPADLAALVDRALSPNAADRFGTADDLVLALLTWLAAQENAPATTFAPASMPNSGGPGMATLASSARVPAPSSPHPTAPPSSAAFASAPVTAPGPVGTVLSPQVGPPSSRPHETGAPVEPPMVPSGLALEPDGLRAAPSLQGGATMGGGNSVTPATVVVLASDGRISHPQLLALGAAPRSRSLWPAALAGGLAVLVLCVGVAGLGWHFWGRGAPVDARDASAAALAVDASTGDAGANAEVFPELVETAEDASSPSPVPSASAAKGLAPSAAKLMTSNTPASCNAFNGSWDGQKCVCKSASGNPVDLCSNKRCELLTGYRGNGEHVGYCGACGVSCSGENRCIRRTDGAYRCLTCNAPTSYCSDGQAGGRCVDTTKDSKNCGKCRSVCGTGAKCVAGKCVMP